MKALRFSLLTLTLTLTLTAAAQSFVLTDSHGRLLRYDMELIDSISFDAENPSLTLCRADGTTDTWSFADVTLAQMQDATDVPDEELYKFKGDKAQSAIFYPNRW